MKNNITTKKAAEPKQKYKYLCFNRNVITSDNWDTYDDLAVETTEKLANTYDFFVKIPITASAARKAQMLAEVQLPA